MPENYIFAGMEYADFEAVKGNRGISEYQGTEKHPTFERAADIRHVADVIALGYGTSSSAVDGDLGTIEWARGMRRYHAEEFGIPADKIHIYREIVTAEKVED